MPPPTMMTLGDDEAAMVIGDVRSRWARHGNGSKSLRPIFLNSRLGGLVAEDRYRHSAHTGYSETRPGPQFRLIAVAQV